MIILTGPSASGKTATCLYLQSHYGIRKVITHTTRPMREGEVNDRDYHFVSVEEFKAMIDRDEFVEHVFYNGNYYGTSKKEVGIDKCMAVELGGAMTYKSFGDPKIVLFFMKLDEETCRERMIQRGDPEEKALKRIENDKFSFTLSEKMKSMIDDYVETGRLNLEQAADFIYRRYLELLKERGIQYPAAQ